MCGLAKRNRIFEFADVPPESWQYSLSKVRLREIFLGDVSAAMYLSIVHV